jgi:hypothetical protein
MGEAAAKLTSSTRVRWLATLAAALLATLAPAAPISAYDRPALLERVASAFALRPAEVRCPSMAEWVSDPIWGISPNPQRAWGYTDTVHEHVVLHPTLCAGAAGIADDKLPAWERAAGTLVLVHEAYHLRPWRYRSNEAQVECRAIQSFTRCAELLGASPELANDLLPYALAAHARMIKLFPEYRARRCRLPLWGLPMTP